MLCNERFQVLVYWRPSFQAQETLFRNTACLWSVPVVPKLGECFNLHAPLSDLSSLSGCVP